MTRQGWLVNRRATVFLRYARQKAERYGAKGARATTTRQTLALLEAAEATHGSAARLLVEYGARALSAGHDGGADWKSLSHAVRVGQEGVELLRTGRLASQLR